MKDPLLAQAEKLAKELKKRKQRVVFAESCTGGLVSATLARIAGVSEVLCGSLVVYRNDSKAKWLGIPAGVLRDPGPVSAEVAMQMATRLLKMTPEATIAAAVTGHLGPNAPKELDGLVFVAVCMRGKQEAGRLRELWLLADDTRSKRIATLREERQRLATFQTLFMVRSVLKSGRRFGDVGGRSRTLTERKKRNGHA